MYPGTPPPPDPTTPPPPESSMGRFYTTLADMIVNMFWEPNMLNHIEGVLTCMNPRPPSPPPSPKGSSMGRFYTTLANKTVEDCEYVLGAQYAKP